MKFPHPGVYGTWERFFGDARFFQWNSNGERVKMKNGKMSENSHIFASLTSETCYSRALLEIKPPFDDIITKWCGKNGRFQISRSVCGVRGYDEGENFFFFEMNFFCFFFLLLLFFLKSWLYVKSSYRSNLSLGHMRWRLHTLITRTNSQNFFFYAWWGGSVRRIIITRIFWKFNSFECVREWKKEHPTTAMMVEKNR